MKNISNQIRRKVLAIMLTAAMIFTAMPVLAAPAFTASAASITATGKVNTNSVILWTSENPGATVIVTLNQGQAVTIHKEVFTKAKNTDPDSRWYYVTAGNCVGYVRSDYVSDIAWSNTAAVTTDELNFRSGPDTSFPKLGTTGIGAPVTLLLSASLSGSTSEWYKVGINNVTAYVSADYIKLGTSLFIQKSAKELEGRSELAKALLINPTRGGKARVVAAFTKDNCTKRFAIKGYKKAKVPQGFAYTGSGYYILYGMAAGQSIVTYSADGKRIGQSKFAFSIGHPNGITWDPNTGLCYIFKGNTKKFYTWNPAANQFGKAKAPYSSSGVAYDNTTNLIYATSRSGVRMYSSDGAFTHYAIFPRCSPGVFHYPQDCGAGEGFIFHGISGKNKKTKNQLDIYRAEDMAYLGSIKITIGEVESAVVGQGGYLELLINTKSTTDYIWKTPLNINELK